MAKLSSTKGLRFGVPFSGKVILTAGMVDSEQFDNSNVTHIECLRLCLLQKVLRRMKKILLYETEKKKVSIPWIHHSAL